MHDLVITDVFVVHSPDQKPVNIGITGGQITYIGEENITGKKVINGRNHLAVPGWVNTHTHIAMTLLRSYGDDLPLQNWLFDKIMPAENNFDRQSIKLGTELGIIEMIKGGTTCFSDMYFEEDVTAQVVQQSGIRGVLSRAVTVFDPGVDAKLSETKKLKEQWHNQAEGRIKVMVGPHAPYTLGREDFLKVCEFAAEQDLTVHTHLAETHKEVDDCIAQNNLTPVAYLESLGVFDLPVVAAHCAWVNEEDQNILARHKVAVAHNPQSNLKLGSGIAPVTGMFDKGILVTVGTDGCASNNNLDMLEEIRFACLLAKGVSCNPIVIPAQIALEMGTFNGAKALGFDKLGRIETGYKADIVLYKMTEPYWYPRHDLRSILIYAASSADVNTVICDGRILMENREILTLDEEKILYAANREGLSAVK